MSEKTNKPEVSWSHCNECGHETKHDVVHRTDRRRMFDYDQFSVEVESVWSVIQCRGCEEVSLRRVNWCSEDDPMDGPEPCTYFPPRVSRRKPAWVGRLAVPSEYTELLDEIYVALHADSRRLAMMGARALIDMAITRSVGDQGGFGRGLDSLVKKELISERNRGIIEAAVNVGNASAHRGHRPSSDDVSVVIDIVENLIHNELLAEPAQALKLTTPPREQARAGKKKD